MWLCYAFVAVCAGAGLLGKAPLIGKLAHLPLLAVIGLVLVSLMVPVFWWLLLPLRRVIGVAALVGIALCALVILPKMSRLHAIGRGSDVPDCIIVAGHEGLAGRWPYNIAKMWSGHPMSCGPGWVAVQAPVVETVGYPASFAVFSLVSAGALVWMLGVEQGLMLLFLCALSPGFWLAASNGNDFFTFGLVLTALQVAAQRMEGGRRSGPAMVLGVATGLVAQFRVVTVLVPALQGRLTGKRGAIVGSAVALVCEAGFFVWNPMRYVHEGPLHLFWKLTGGYLAVGHPWLLAGAGLLTGVVLVAGLLWLGERVKPSVLLFAYLAVVIGIPAVQDLAAKLRFYGSARQALEFWEGGVWLVGLLPLASLMVVQRYRDKGVGVTE